MTPLRQIYSRWLGSKDVSLPQSLSIVCYVEAALAQERSHYTAAIPGQPSSPDTETIRLCWESIRIVTGTCRQDKESRTNSGETIIYVGLHIHLNDQRATSYCLDCHHCLQRNVCLNRVRHDARTEWKFRWERRQSCSHRVGHLHEQSGAADFLLSTPRRQTLHKDSNKPIVCYDKLAWPHVGSYCGKNRTDNSGLFGPSMYIDGSV